MKPPLVSVVMSIHNQASYLPLTLDSLKQQTYKTYECIFIDDASIDATGKILKAYKTYTTTLITNPHRYGLARSLNQGINAAHGKYIARMDADDICIPQRLKLQVNFMEKNPRVAVCGTAATLINETGLEIGHKQYPANPRQTILQYNPIIHPTAMIRASVIKSIGEYDESLNGAEDYDLWLRINKRHQLANLPNVLLKYRINPHGISWGKLKHVEKQALRARWKAVWVYGYPKSQIVHLLKPLISYLIPTSLKKNFFNIT